MTTDDRLLPSYLNKQRGQLTQPRSVGSQIKNHTANIRDEIERRDRLISAHQQQIIDGSAVLAAKDAEIERLRLKLLAAEFNTNIFEDRALTAESAVAAAWERAEKHAVAALGQHGSMMFIQEHGWAGLMEVVASAIRAAGAEKTAESGHSPSTHNSESE